MGCQQCGVAPYAGISYPYRWKNATIEIIACQDHAREIITVLNKAQVVDAPDQAPVQAQDLQEKKRDGM